MGPQGKRSFSEFLVVADKQAWVWTFATKVLVDMQKEHVRLPSTVSIRQSWQRFRDAERIIVHWECQVRSGGAVIEEIIEVDPLFNVGERLIVLTTNPMHNDVVYLNELGVTKIIKLQNRGQEIERAAHDFKGFIQNGETNPKRASWAKFLRALNYISGETPESELDRLTATLEALHVKDERKPTAMYFDAAATLAATRGNSQEALRLWHKALELNPNYFRTYNNLVEFYRRNQLFDKAIDLLRKMHVLNNNSIARMVKFGEMHVAMQQDDRAEHYFVQALDKDKFCSAALNGLAEVRFRQGHLEEARDLLARSTIAYKVAAYLNKCGVDLVQQNKYQEALEHYSKAQFVLPNQEKGPMLFFNIGLCYSRWGKPEMAAEFLKIALIKEPNYSKAQRLLEQVQNKVNPLPAAG